MQTDESGRLILSEADQLRWDKKVAKAVGCWLWTGKLGSKGYGAFRLGDKIERAHKVAYMVAHGPVQTGFVVRHTCPGQHTMQNRACVRPEHLTVGSNDDNVADRASHGTRINILSISGLNEDQVSEICESKDTDSVLGLVYGLDRKLIRKIRRRRVWRDVLSPAVALKLESLAESRYKSPSMYELVPTADDEARFWSFVAKGDDCWLWTGMRFGDYGAFYCQGKNRYAHRVSYIISVSRLQPGLDVAHDCANALCVRSDHLKLVPRKINMANKATRSRLSAGHKGNMSAAKITHEVAAIVRHRLARGETSGTIGKDYELTEENIQKIGKGESWTEVGGPVYQVGTRKFRPAGDKSGRSKVTWEQVNEIRQRAANGEHAIALADEFKMSRRNIDDIVKRRTWKTEASVITAPSSQATSISSVFNIALLDLERYRPAVGSNEETVLTDLVFEHYRRDGFPYPQVSDGDIQAGFLALQQAATCLNDGVIRLSPIGSKLATPFHKHMFEVQCRDARTLMEAFSDDETLRQAITRQIQTGRRLTKAAVRRSLTNESHVQGPSNFRPTAAKSIYQHFNSKLTVDFSMGWGGRMLGAMAAGVEYVGIDPSSTAIAGNAELLLSIQRLCPSAVSKVEITQACAEDVLGQQRWRPDLIFTSPPYFNVERYSNEPTQSFKRYPTLSEWYTGFLDKCILGAFIDLIPGGHLVLNINPDMVVRTLTAASKTGFEILQPLTLQLAARAFQKESKAHREEPILVFRRPG